jgi:ATP-dependent helicase/DNAse subunit B
MVEKQFPHLHQQDPFFPDPARCRLNAGGIRVRTAAEFEREERALFDTATSRATMLVTLSYPEFDSRGERNLPSIFLEDLNQPPVDSVPMRPAPRHVPAPRSAPQVAAGDLLDFLQRKTARLSPSGLEIFLQCPFQYFTQRLMRLKTAPPRPEERLSFLEQGNIVHEVLAAWWHEPQDVAPLFERVFGRRLEEAHIPYGYHTERLRNAMLDDLKRFTSQDVWPRAGFQSQTEIPFAFPLAEGLEISGRIDRLDVAPDGRAFVLDYKYSAAQRVKDKLKNENLMQAPLYLMAAEHLNFRPAGMFYVGVKGAIEYAGWSDDQRMDSLALPENWLPTTRDRTLQIVEEIRRGRVEVLPADRDSCRFCDSKDVCRIEVAAAAAETESA